MLPSKNRLTKREDFAAVYARGSYAAFGAISLKYLRNDKQEFVRLGFSVGKKFSPKAVERNRAKRLMRAASLELIKNLKPGWDVIIMIRPEGKNLSCSEIFTSLQNIFTKLKLFIQ